MSLIHLLPEALCHHQQGNLEEARKLYEKVIQAHPNHPDALNLLGCLYSQTGDSQRGESLLKKAVEVSPSSAPIWFNLANLQRERNKIEESLDSLQKTLEIDPTHAQACDQLCALALQVGQFGEAERAGRKAVRLAANNASCWNNLGAALYRKGNLQEAESCFLKACELNPDLLGPLGNLGACYMDMGQLNRAFDILEQAIAKELPNSENLNNMGCVIRLLGDGLGSIAMMEKALALDPANSSIRNNYGLALKAGEKIEDACRVFESLLEDDPTFLMARMNHAAILVDLGRFPDASRAYERIISDHPEMCEAYRLMGYLSKWKEDDPLLDEMQTILKNSNLPGEQSLHLHFALAKAYDDLGEIKRSFSHFESGNQITRQGLNYSTGSQKSSFEDMKRFFTPSLFESQKGSGFKSTIPIFILGMPRSGTSLVEQILSSHPTVRGAGERTDMAYLLFGPDSPFENPNSFAEVSSGKINFSRLGEEYTKRISQASGGVSHVTDKMPHNFQYIGLIHMMLPNAAIIHCTRDPMDTCFSCYTNYFTGYHPYSYNQQELGEYYLLYRDLMSHWHDVLPGRILDLDYESLVENPEREIRRLLDYCSLSWDDRCLRFHETRRAVTSMSSSQVRRPLYKGSIEKWKRFEPYLQPLIEVLQIDC